MPTIGSPSAWRRLCFVLPVIAIVILCSTAMRAPVGVGPATKVVALGPGGRFRSQAGQDLYVYERFFRHRPGPGPRERKKPKRQGVFFLFSAFLFRT